MQKRQSINRRKIVFLLLFFMALGLQLTGQEAPLPPPPEQTHSEATVRSDPEVEASLEGIRINIRDKDWPAARGNVAALLGYLRAGEHNGVAAAANDARRFTGVWRAAQELARAVPGMFDAPGECAMSAEEAEEFEAALLRAQPRELARYAEGRWLDGRRCKAARMLADLKFEEGRYAEAYAGYRDLLRQWPPELSGGEALLGRWLYCAGALGLARRALAEIEELGFADAVELVFDGRAMTVAQAAAAAEDMRELADATASERVLSEAWSGVSGCASGAGVAGGEFRPGLPRWSAPTGDSAVSEQALHAYARRGLPVEPCVFPAAAADSVIVALPDGVRCLEAATGAERWRFGARKVKASTVNLFHRISGAAVEGGCVCVVYERMIVGLTPGGGKALWICDPEQLSKAPELGAWKRDALQMMKEARRFSPPTGADGRVVVAYYVHAGGDTKTYAACLDAATGELEWNTFICAGFTGDFLGAGNAVTPPSVSGGRVFVQTNLGGVCALQLATGRIDWLYRYPTPSPAQRARRMAQGDHWSNDRQCAALEEHVLFAPVDCDSLLCCDRFTGDLLWSVERGGAGRFAGVWGREAVVIGSDVACYDLAGGALTRKAALPAASAGRAVFYGEDLWIPTDAAWLRVSMKTLEVESYDVAAGGGNLLPCGGGMLWTGARTMQWFESARQSGERIALRLRDDPGDAQALREQAALLEAAGDCAGAYRSFVKLVEALPRATDIQQETYARMRGELIECALRCARREAQAGRLDSALEMAQGARGYAKLAQHFADATLLLGELCEQQGRAAEAVDAYQELLEQYERAEVEWLGARCSGGLVALSRIEACAAARGMECYKTQEARAQALFDGALEKQSARELEFLLEHFPLYSKRAEAALTAARWHEAAGDALRAEAVLSAYARRFPGDAGIPRVAQALAKLARGGKRDSEARLWLARALEALGSGDGDSALKEELAAELAALSAGGLPAVEPGLSLCWQRSALSTVYLPEIVAGDTPECPVFLLRYGDVVECRRIDSGRKLWERAFPGHLQNLALLGDVAALQAVNEVVVIEAHSGAPLWQLRAAELDELHPESGLIRHAMLSKTRIVIGFTDTVCALDARSGEALWKREFAGERVQKALANARGEIAVVLASGVAYALESASGAVAATVEIIEDGEAVDLEALLTEAGTLAVAVRETGTQQRRYKIFDLRDGKLLALFSPEKGIHRIIEGDDRAALLTFHGGGKAGVIAVDLSNGEELWTRQLAAASARSWQIVRGELVFSALAEDAREHVYGYRMADGEVSFDFIPEAVGALPDLVVCERYGLLYSMDSSRMDLILWDGKAVAQRIDAGGCGMDVQAAAAGGGLIVVDKRNVYGWLPVSGERSRLNVLRAAAEEGAPRDARQAAALARDCMVSGQFGLAAEIASLALVMPELSQLDFQDLFELKEGAREAQAQRKPGELRAVKFTQAPKIDGHLNDAWVEHESMELRGMEAVELVQGLAGTFSGTWCERDGGGLQWLPDWRGGDDLSAKLYLGWDEENVYLLLDVNDSRRTLFDHEAELSVGDVLYVAFDCTGAGGYRYSPDHIYDLVLAHMKQPRAGGGAAADPAQRPAGEYMLRRKADDSGAVYEMAIPWASLAEFGAGKPIAGKTLGFAFALADDDLPYRGDETLDEIVNRNLYARKALNCAPGLSIFRRKRDTVAFGYAPELFARLTLVE